MLLLRLLTWILICGVPALNAVSVSNSCDRDSNEPGNGRPYITTGDLRDDILRLPSANLCKNFDNLERVAYGLLNFYYHKIRILCDKDGNRYMKANIKMRDTTKQYIDATIKIPTRAPIPIVRNQQIQTTKPLQQVAAKIVKIRHITKRKPRPVPGEYTDLQVKIISVGESPKNVAIAGNIEIKISRPDYVWKAPHWRYIRSQASTLTYLAGTTFFKPLEEKLEAISYLINDYCHRMYTGQDMEAISFDIVIDTAIVTPLFRCDSTIVQLSKDDRTESTYVITEFYDGNQRLSLRYDREKLTYEWRKSGTEDRWTSGNCAESWRVISLVEGPKNPNRSNDKFEGTDESKLRFYLEDLETSLDLMWGVTTGPGLLSGLKEPTLRIGKSAIILQVKLHHKSVTSLTESQQSVRTLIKIITSNVGGRSPKKEVEGPSLNQEEVYFHQSGLCTESGEKYPNAHRLFVCLQISKPALLQPLQPITDQFIRIDDITKLFDKHAQYIQDQLVDGDHQMIAPVHFVYGDHVLPTVFNSNGMAFLMDALTIFKMKRIPGQVDIRVVTVDYSRPVCYLVKEKRFTPDPSIFKYEALAVRLELEETVNDRFGNFKFERVKKEGDWEIQILSQNILQPIKMESKELDLISPDTPEKSDTEDGLDMME